MRKKLMRVGNSLALVMTHDFLGLLGLPVEGEPEVELTVLGDELIVRAPDLPEAADSRTGTIETCAREVERIANRNPEGEGYRVLKMAARNVRHLKHRKASGT